MCIGCSSHLAGSADDCAVRWTCAYLRGEPSNSSIPEYMPQAPGAITDMAAANSIFTVLTCTLVRIFLFLFLYTQAWWIVWNVDDELTETVSLGLSVYFHTLAARRESLLAFYGVVGFLCVNLMGGVKRSPKAVPFIICICAKSCPSAEDTLCSVWTFDLRRTEAVACLTTNHR